MSSRARAARRIHRLARSGARNGHATTEPVGPPVRQYPQARGAGGWLGDVQVAVPISGEGRAGQRSVAGRVTARGGRPWAAPHSDSDHHRPGPRAQGSGWTGGRPMYKPPGPGSGCGRDLTRGPHGLLPLRRDPGPPRLKDRPRGQPSREPARLSLTPGSLGGPRGQGPTRTNPAPAKRRADARIQNPSDAHRRGINPKPRAALRVAPHPRPCSLGGAISSTHLLLGPVTLSHSARHRDGRRNSEHSAPQGWHRGFRNTKRSVLGTAASKASKARVVNAPVELLPRDTVNRI